MIVRLETVIEPGELAGVNGLMPTAFQLELVMSIDCELSGNTPSDHDDASSHAPLPGFVHEFTRVEAMAELKAKHDATKKQIARPIPIVPNLEVRMVVPFLLFSFRSM